MRRFFPPFCPPILSADDLVQDTEQEVTLTTSRNVDPSEVRRGYFLSLSLSQRFWTKLLEDFPLRTFSPRTATARFATKASKEGPTLSVCTSRLLLGSARAEARPGCVTREDVRSDLVLFEITSFLDLPMGNLRLLPASVPFSLDSFLSNSAFLTRSMRSSRCNTSCSTLTLPAIEATFSISLALLTIIFASLAVNFLQLLRPILQQHNGGGQ